MWFAGERGLILEHAQELNLKHTAMENQKKEHDNQLDTKETMETKKQKRNNTETANDDGDGDADAGVDVLLLLLLLLIVS